MWSASYKTENQRKIAVQTSIKTIDYHRTDDAVYNMQGMRMNPNRLPHGLYIINGKKQ